MTDVQIGQMDTVIELQQDTVTAMPPGAAPAAAGGDEIERLRALLRPIIIELLEDELGTYRRMRG